MADEGYEEIWFKQTEAGWVFKLDSPFVFGPVKYYLVDDAQKALIAARLRSGWPVRLALAAALIALSAASPWLGALSNLEIILIVWALSYPIELLRLQGLMANMPRTGQRISSADSSGTGRSIYPDFRLSLFLPVLLLLLSSI